MPWLAVGCAVLYAIFLWRLAAELPGQAHPTASWPVAALEAILSVWLTVLCLLAGQRLLHRPSATMQYLAQSAYWTYLLRSEEHTSELQSLMRISYAVFC